MAQGITEKIKGFMESDSGVSTLGMAVDRGQRSNTPEAFYLTSKSGAPQAAADNTPKPSDESAYKGTDAGYNGQEAGKPLGTEKGADFSTTEGGAADKYLGTGESAEKAAENPSGTGKGADFSTDEGGELEKYLGTGESAEKAAENPSGTEKGADFSTDEGGELEKYV